MKLIPLCGTHACRILSESMNNNRPVLFLILFSAFLLSGCLQEETPQEVNEAFWEAVIDGSTANAIKYSTLENAEGYDGFSKKWDNYSPSWGRVVIDGDRASVVSEFARRNTPEKVRRSFTTYLVRKDGDWLVDYARTERSVNAGLFGDLFGQLAQLGQGLPEQIYQPDEDPDSEVRQMLDEFERAYDQLGDQASEALEKYYDELNEVFREMNESLQDSLEKEREKRGEKEKDSLHSAAAGFRGIHIA